MFARLAAISLLLAATACGGTPDAPATQRLWVSGVPTSPKAQFTAFVTVRDKGGNYFGSFYRGSALRGSHDAIRWEPHGNEQATVTFLQDGSSRDVQLRTCTPDTGFHHCIRLVGGPYGVEKYQSRKRWVVMTGEGGPEAAQQVLDMLAAEAS